MRFIIHDLGSEGDLFLNRLLRMDSLPEDDDIASFGLLAEFIQNHPIPSPVVCIRIKLAISKNIRTKDITVGFIDMPLTGEMLMTWSLAKMMVGTQRTQYQVRVQVSADGNRFRSTLHVVVDEGEGVEIPREKKSLL